MTMDERVNDLHEMAAIGNVKAVLHYCQSGVNINAQNSMNGWTALHWAAHRGHEPVVRALVMRGASKEIQNHKGQTPVDLAKKPDICALLGKDVQEQDSKEEENKKDDKPIFVPAYLAQPDLSKLWSMPDGSTDDAKLNQEAFALSNPNIPASTPAPRLATGSTSTSTPLPVQTQSNSYAAKEILVYSQTVSDDSLMGAIFANIDDTIETTLQLIREEIDDVPEEFGLGRFNGSKTIPVNTKQYTRKTGDMFRGDEDAMVIIRK
ncbi:Ankyrin repeat domain-containing protein 40 [Podila clonocystis]|nr:Ankyrin repeat domain-containing protein 40 [Podila clonocystis]